MTPPRNPSPSSEVVKALRLQARGRMSTYYAEVLERYEKKGMRN